jgi:hypothetical protein
VFAQCLGKLRSLLLRAPVCHAGITKEKVIFKYFADKKSLADPAAAIDHDKFRLSAHREVIQEPLLFLSPDHAAPHFFEMLECYIKYFITAFYYFHRLASSLILSG